MLACLRQPTSPHLKTWMAPCCCRCCSAIPPNWRAAAGPHSEDPSYFAALQDVFYNDIDTTTFRAVANLLTPDDPSQVGAVPDGENRCPLGPGAPDLHPLPAGSGDPPGVAEPLHPGSRRVLPWQCHRRAGFGRRQLRLHLPAASIGARAAGDREHDAVAASVLPGQTPLSSSMNSSAVRPSWRFRPAVTLRLTCENVYWALSGVYALYPT